MSMDTDTFKKKAVAMGYEQDPVHYHIWRKGNQFITEHDLMDLMIEMQNAAEAVVA